MELALDGGENLVAEAGEADPGLISQSAHSVTADMPQNHKTTFKRIKELEKYQEFFIGFQLTRRVIPLDQGKVLVLVSDRVDAHSSTTSAPGLEFSKPLGPL
jgi:hypothetical protein